MLRANRSTFLLMFICGFSCMSLAQMRIIPHVTRADGGFVSEIVIVNLTASTQPYTLTPYNSSGEVITGEVEEGRINPGVTIRQDAETMFGADVSHVVVDTDRDMTVMASYRADTDSSTPAVVRDTADQSKIWRFFGGNLDVTWDGVAVINKGSVPSVVTLHRVDETGNPIETFSPIFPIQPMAKSLFVLSDIFTITGNDIFEVHMEEDSVVMALRGNQGGSTLLWQNLALPMAQ